MNSHCIRVKNMSILFGILLFIFSCQSESNSTQNTSNQENTSPNQSNNSGADKDRKLIVFGQNGLISSNTSKDTYPKILSNLLEAEGFSIEVIDELKGGSHSGSLANNNKENGPHGMDRINEKVRAKSPDYVLLDFGLNDSWIDGNSHNDPSRIPLENFRNNLGIMIQTLTAENVKILLLTPNPMSSSAESFRNDRLEMYANVIRELANQFSIPIVDNWYSFQNYALNPEKSMDDLLVDGISPNEQGYEMIANDLSATIVYMLNGN